jgi:hypothetical protein
MAIKPTEQPEVWASQLLYSSGPKVGQPTKSSSEAGLAVEGHKPGPTEPTTANEFNVFEHKVSLLSRWTFEGRYDKMDDAHIVETDSSGLLSARAADFGDATKAGPSLFVSNSSSDWTARFNCNNTDGVRIQGTYSTASSNQLCLVTSDLDNDQMLHALRVHCTNATSCGGIRIVASAQGVISGEDMLAACTVENTGGTAMQVRAIGSPLPAARFLNREDGGITARFGHGHLETGSKNLDGIAIDCRGGDADPGSLNNSAGEGIFTRGGNSDGTFKMAGNGITAFSGSTATAMPGGAAVWAQTVGSRGIAVEASHNSESATLPVVLATAENNDADCFEAVCTEGGNGVDVFAQAGSGVRITMDPDLGGDVGHAINLQVQNEPTSTSAAGQMWVQQGGSKIDLRTGLGSGTKGYVLVGKNCPCYAKSAYVPAFILSGAQVDQTVAADFTWGTDQAPAAADEVIVTIYGQVNMTNNDATSCTLKVRDKTVGGNPTICSITVAKPDHGVASFTIQAATTSQPYTLPTNGARTFDLVWEGDAGAASGSFKGWVEIKEAAG